MSTNYARRSGNLAILASLLAVPLLLSASSATFAQDAGPPQAAAGPSNCGQRGGGGGLEEVCVTANRQGVENIQQVPMAITAIQPESIENLGLTGLQDYTRLVPSVSMQIGAPGLNRIDIRGITTGSFDTTNVQDRSLVAIYYDDTPISLQSSNPDLKVFDLQDVEVLRGPQGTLYGAGAMAGTIRLITTKPDLNHFDGSVETTLSGTTEGSGGFNYSLRGMLNIPLVDDMIALRLVAYRGSDSGWITNVGLHESGANWYTTDQGRAALRIRASDALTIDASFTFEGMHTGGLNDAYDGLPPYSFTSLENEGDSDNFKLANVTATYDLGWATASSSTSYLDRHFHDIYGDEYGPTVFLGPFSLGYGPTPGWNFTWDALRDVIEEARLVSNKYDDLPLKWTAGVFYEHTWRNNLQDQPYLNLDPEMSVVAHTFYGVPQSFQYNSTLDGAFGPNDDFSGFQNISEHQIAVYGEATYTLWDRLDLTAGLRYFDWAQNFNLFFGGAFGCSPCAFTTGAAGVPLTQTGDAGAKGIDPRFAITFHIDDDKLVYFEASKGFRYGGVNQPIPLSICLPYLQQLGLSSGPISFGPDKLWNYEVGEKSSFFDHHLTLNVTGFLIEWQDVQTEQSLPCAYYFVENKGSIQSRGIEVETSAKLAEGLTVSGNVSYTNAVADGSLVNIGALNGDPAPYFPRWIASVTAEYVVPVDENNLEFQANFSYKSQAYSGFNSSSFGYAELPSNTQLNLSINYIMPTWEVGLFADNVTDGYKIQAYGANYYGPGGLFGVDLTPGRPETLARPRTIGLRAKLNFGGASEPAVVEPPPTPPLPPPPPAPAVEAKRSFQVFFDFDKSNITQAAASVIQAAADAVKAGNVVQITVTGHTDTVGTAAYNQGLSERRAASVKAQLVTDGVSAGEIATVGVGKNGLLVPTADGVREPQNRRAEIVLQ
ncbi:MAG TPA: OmpA family protein [Stellaceae bacterium]|nr:OmpA family protein [Stellaceae bacterium]